jgi:hypothetical protein
LFDDDRQFRLTAEAQAWPLVASAAFVRRVVSLERDQYGELTKPMAELSETLVDRLRSVGRSLSLETIRSVRDLAWFGAGDQQTANRVPLDEHLARVAQAYLRPTPSGWELSANDNLPALVRRFRWLSLMLPTDLLIAAHAAGRGGDAHGTSISLVPPVLKKALAAGVAETHVHMGGAFCFSLLWTAMMRDIATRLPSFEERGARTSLFGDPKRSQGKLYAAAITRLVLARFIGGREHGRVTRKFQAQVQLDIDDMSRGLASPQTGRVWVRSALSSLLGGDGHPSARALRFLYSRLIGPSKPAQSLDELRSNDPLSALFPAPPSSTAEMRFTTAALKYIRRAHAAGDPDTRFEVLFWQYCRVRVRLFRYFTMDPGMAGLDWFSDAYKRIGPLRGSLEHLQAEATLEHQSKDATLAVAELRTTPQDARPPNLELIRFVAEQALRWTRSGRNAPEVGVTFHFVKEKRSRKGGKKHVHADPGAPLLSSRYARWVRDCQRKTLALEATLRAFPEMLLLANGMDVAGPELSIPTWPTLIPLRDLRTASERAAAVLARRYPHWSAAAMRLTYHAGEDFRRLSEGIRRIDEVRRYAPLRSGDRIGHGLALFMSPKIWAQRFPRTFQPIDARLDDLLWELEHYHRLDFVPASGRVPFVEAEALRLAEAMYGRGRATIKDLLDARNNRHDPSYLKSLGYPAILPGRRATPALLDAYLRDRSVYIRGRESIEVRADDSEVEMLVMAQKRLMQCLWESDITVETNPSSNQLIADFDCLDQHPVFSHMVAESWNGVSCSVNTDNPLTFVTHLSHEFAYVYFALVRGGCSSARAMARIEELREAGLRSRFTHAASTSPEVLEQLLRL